MSKKTQKRRNSGKGRSRTQKVTVKVKQQSNAGKTVAIVAIIVAAILAVVGAIGWLFAANPDWKLPFGLFGDNGAIDAPIDGDGEGENTESDADSESSADDTDSDSSSGDDSSDSSTEDTDGEEDADGVYVIRFDDGKKILPLRTTESGVLEIFPTTSREGFTFIGWYDDAGNSYAAPHTFTEDMTLTAKWKADNVYTVTFIVDGQTYFTTTTNDSGMVSEEPEKPEKDGYAFKCWNTAADESGEYVSLNDTFTEDMTVYAIFTEIESGEGGAENPDDNEGEGGDSGSGLPESGEGTQTPEGGEGGDNTGDGTESGDGTQTPEGGNNTGDGDNTQDPDNPNTGDNTENGDNTQDPDNPNTGDNTENGDSGNDDGNEGGTGSSAIEFSGTITEGDTSTVASVPGRDFAGFAAAPNATLTAGDVAMTFDKGTSSYETPTAVGSDTTRFYEYQKLYFQSNAEGEKIKQIVFTFSGQLTVEDLPDVEPGDIVYDAETDTTTVTLSDHQFAWVGESDIVVFTFNSSIIIRSVDITYEANSSSDAPVVNNG